MSRNLSDWIDSYLEWTSDDEPEEIYRLWSAISGIAACLQRKCYVRKTSRLIFYPNFYIALTGPSGTRKTTAIAPIHEFLTDLGVELAATVTSKEKLIGALEKLVTKTSSEIDQGESRFDIDQPVFPHASLTAISSELMVFFPQKDEGFVGYLLDLFDCRPDFKYDTYKRGEQVVENVFFNLIGGITFDKLKRRMTDEVIGSGLFGRFILVYAPSIGKLVADPKETRENKKVRALLIDDLREILMLHGQFEPTKDWKALYEDWYENRINHTKFAGTMLDGYSERRGSYIHKLSMISSASRGSSKLLTVEDYERSMRWLMTAEDRMLEIAGGLGASEHGLGIDSILHYLRGTTKPVFFSAMLNRFMNQYTREELIRILDTLREVGKIRMTKTRTDKTDVMGNPIMEIVIKYIREEPKSEQE